jgi:hypothetical protein
MTYGLYRGGHGDVYRIEPSDIAGHVVLRNITNSTQSILLAAHVQQDIDDGWLVKIEVSDLGSDES